MPIKLTEQEFDDWFENADYLTIKALCFEGMRVKGYTEEIRDLKNSLKYATAVYHGNLLKIKLEEGYCPICGNLDLPHGKKVLHGQESCSLADQQSHETAPQPS